MGMNKDHYGCIPNKSKYMPECMNEWVNVILLLLKHKNQLSADG